MLKVSGALLVFFAGWGMGNWRSRQYQQRIKDLQILQLIISCLIGEISYARNTLPEAFSRISEKVASPFQEYLQSVAKRLKEQTGEAFVRILKEQEQTVRQKTSLREEDWDLFLQAQKHAQRPFESVLHLPSSLRMLLYINIHNYFTLEK